MSAVLSVALMHAGEKRKREWGGKEEKTTYDGDARFFVALGVDGPLPVGTDRIVEGEARGEDDSDGLVRGVFEPVELAVVDEHGCEDVECVWVGARGFEERLPMVG